MNYGPVCLTCITCKLFEHIICKHILAHLEDHKILTDLQHGFRSGRSCETQLVTTFQDLALMHNKKCSQFDIAVLDFSKAFHTVPHYSQILGLDHVYFNTLKFTSVYYYFYFGYRILLIIRFVFCLIPFNFMEVIIISITYFAILTFI